MARAGIWTTLPGSFPQNFKFKTNKPKPVSISYPCAMLNAETQHLFTNHQYHELVDKERKKFNVYSECSILFEVDGPYKAMILPASKEEDKGIKKRYAVFNLDGSLAELKGFEIKRRGELQLIKIFQSEVFKQFLEGTDLDECYNAVATIANNWLDVLDNQGVDVDDEALMDLISEASTMSRSLEDYGQQKSCAITTAKRLGSFLGAEMVGDKGTVCSYIISRQPEGSPVTERAVPIVIFSAEPAIKRQFLRRWLHDPSLNDDQVDIRNLLDWEYYKERLGSTIMKIVTIPAAMQHVTNPVPRVKHPDWLQKRIRELDDGYKQQKLSAFFQTAVSAKEQNLDAPLNDAMDMEDIGTKNTQRPGVPVVRKRQAASGRSARVSVEVPEQEDELPPFAERTQDFAAWLKYKKAQWRRQAAERKRRRIAIANGEDVRQIRSGRLGGISSFVEHAHARLLKEHWQLLQIRPTAQAGKFRLWVVTGDGTIHMLVLDVPRVIYINSYKKWHNHNGKKELDRSLPLGRPCYNLYECPMPEREFIEKASTIEERRADPETEGVYETDMPLLFKVRTCTCTHTCAPHMRTHIRP